MKYFLFAALLVLTTYCSAQKYALVDKSMILPVTYTNAVTAQDNFKGYFPIEKNKLNEFIAEIDKIAGMLNDPKKKRPASFDLSIGNTFIHGLRVDLGTEERIDVILTAEYEDGKSTMHLCDAKISNADNAYFINTWLKYLHNYIN